MSEPALSCLGARVVLRSSSRTRGRRPAGQADDEPRQGQQGTAVWTSRPTAAPETVSSPCEKPLNPQLLSGPLIMQVGTLQHGTAKGHGLPAPCPVLARSLSLSHAASPRSAPQGCGDRGQGLGQACPPFSKEGGRGGGWEGAQLRPPDSSPHYPILGLRKSEVYTLLAYEKTEQVILALGPQSGGSVEAFSWKEKDGH